MTTRTEWAEGFLAYADLQPTRENVDALVAHQAAAEGPGRFNPLAATEDAPTAEQRGYGSLEAGFAATLTWLRSTHPGLYDRLAQATGGGARAYAEDAVVLAPGIRDQLDKIRAGEAVGDDEVTTSEPATVETGSAPEEVGTAATVTPDPPAEEQSPTL